MYSKFLPIFIILLSFLFLPSVSAVNVTVFQEAPNDTGSFTDWFNSSLTYDGDYGTYGGVEWDGGILGKTGYYEYNPPDGSVGAIWTVKYELNTTLDTSNFTIPFVCFDNTYVDARIYTGSEGGTDGFIEFKCYDGKDGYDLFNISEEEHNESHIYEEGIYWIYTIEEIYGFSELSPADYSDTYDATPSHQFKVTGTSDYYNCTLYYDGTPYDSDFSVQNDTLTTLTVNETQDEGNYEWWINCSVEYALGESELESEHRNLLIHYDYSFTYQEEANFSNFTNFQYGVIDNNESFFDGDWDTYAYTSISPIFYIVVMDYNKTDNAVGAVWSIKESILLDNSTANYTIPSDCFDYYSDFVRVRYWFDNPHSNLGYSRMACSKGGDIYSPSHANWVTLATSIDYVYKSDYLFEEAMYWNETTEDITTINIVSPSSGETYESPVNLNVYADEEMDTWLYDIGSGNVTFTPNTSLEFPNGDFTVKVYANNSYDVLGYAESSFTVFNSVTARSPIFSLIIPLAIGLGLLYAVLDILLFQDPNRSLRDTIVENVGIILALLVAASAIAIYMAM